MNNTGKQNLLDSLKNDCVIDWGCVERPWFTNQQHNRQATSFVE